MSYSFGRIAALYQADGKTMTGNYNLNFQMPEL